MSGRRRTNLAARDDLAVLSGGPASTRPERDHALAADGEQPVVDHARLTCASGA